MFNLRLTNKEIVVLHSLLSATSVSEEPTNEMIVNDLLGKVHNLIVAALQKQDAESWMNSVNEKIESKKIVDEKEPVILLDQVKRS